MMFLSNVYRSVKGEIPERSIHFADVVIEQLIVNQSEREEEKIRKTKELEELNLKIEEKNKELEHFKERTEQLIEEAHQNAIQLVAQANRDAEGVREAARQEGWQIGRDEGIARGLEEAQKQIDTAIAVLNAAEAERRDRIVNSESFLIDLTMTAVEQVVREYLPNDQDYIPSLVRTLLVEVERAYKVEVRVSPVDFPSVIHHRQGFERSFVQRVELLILPDRSLTQGDVVVATEYGTVDGRLGTRLEQLHKLLATAAKEWESSVIAESKGE